MNVKLLLKRGALVVGANWPAVAIQFAARTTFQALLVVPVVSAALLVAVLLGGDVAGLLQGGIRDMLGSVANALMSEPVALAAFLVAFGVVLVGGSVFMFLVKGGTVSVLLAAEEAAGSIEREPLHLDILRGASGFSLPRFTGGCTRLFKRYLVLGLTLMLVYGLSAGGYLVVLVYGYRSVEGLAFLGWTFVAAAGAVLLVVWITAVNLLYLLLQIVVAVDDASLTTALRSVGRFVRAEPRRLGGIFIVVFAMVAGATLVSALAWSGIALVAFVPLVGLVVIPLQIAGLLLRGLLFEYIGLTGLSAYLTLYRRSAVRAGASEQATVGRRTGALGAVG